MIEIPKDEELFKQLIELHEECHFQIPKELRGLDWSSFFDDEKEENEKKL